MSDFDEQMNVAKRVMAEEREVLQRLSEDDHKDVYLYSPTLKDLLRECEDLCYRLKVPYDPNKIKITTDFGTKVVVFYDGETE